MGDKRKINGQHSMTIGINSSINRRLFITNNNIPEEDDIVDIINSINNRLDDTIDDNQSIYKEIDYLLVRDELRSIAENRFLSNSLSSLIRRYIYHVIAKSGSYKTINSDMINIDILQESDYRKYYANNPEVQDDKGIADSFYLVLMDYIKKNGFRNDQINKKFFKDCLYGYYSDGENLKENTTFAYKPANKYFNSFITTTSFHLNLDLYNLNYFLDNLFYECIPIKIDEYIAEKLIEKNVNCKRGYGIIHFIKVHETNGQKTIDLIVDLISKNMEGEITLLNPEALFINLLLDAKIDTNIFNVNKLYEEYFDLLTRIKNIHDNIYRDLNELFKNESRFQISVLDNPFRDLTINETNYNEIESTLTRIFDEKYKKKFPYSNVDFFKNRSRKFSYVIHHTTYVRRKDIIAYYFILYCLAIDLHLIKIDAESSMYVETKIDYHQKMYMRKYKRKFIYITNTALVQMGFSPLSVKKLFDQIIILAIMHDPLDSKYLNSKLEKIINQRHMGTATNSEYEKIKSLLEETPLSFFLKYDDKYGLLKK